MERMVYLFSFCLLGASIGGIGTGVLNGTLLGGTNGIALRDIEGLPVDVERTDGVSSTKFRPNYLKLLKENPISLLFLKPPAPNKYVSSSTIKCTDQTAHIVTIITGIKLNNPSSKFSQLISIQIIDYHKCVHRGRRTPNGYQVHVYPFQVLFSRDPKLC